MHSLSSATPTILVAEEDRKIHKWFENVRMEVAQCTVGVRSLALSSNYRSLPAPVLSLLASPRIQKMCVKGQRQRHSLHLGTRSTANGLQRPLGHPLQ